VTRAPRSTVLVLLLLAISICQPGIVAGEGPLTPPRPAQTIVPGSIVLPNGRVLPPQPRGVGGPSEMAVQWLAHANDRIAFTPGHKPQPLVPA